MRLAPTLFRPSRSLATVATGPLDAPKGEAGSEGYALLADLQGGGPDVNPELTGHAKQHVYDEMRKTDPTIKSLLWFFQLPIRSANWVSSRAPTTPSPASSVTSSPGTSASTTTSARWSSRGNRRSRRASRC